jgi:hypothetical protein
VVAVVVELLLVDGFQHKQLVLLEQAVLVLLVQQQPLTVETLITLVFLQKVERLVAKLLQQQFPLMVREAVAQELQLQLEQLLELLDHLWRIV